MFGRQFSLQPNFFGVELFDEPREKDDAARLLDSVDGEAILGRKKGRCEIL